MYGTREELCVQLENMFTFDEPLVLLVWTEEGISMACRETQPEPDGAEIRSVMKSIGEMKMTQYRQEGVNNLTINDLLTRQREAANRQVSVPSVLLSRVLRNYACDLENRIGMAWEAGRQEPESVRDKLKDVHALQEALAA
ncbi:DUF1380 family protein [Citrobacter amalonaticus]|uniref:DUF1380 family protein n=1 Tax=Citrobacter amalonaticus TaxID=35703 RepID=UPI00292AC16D|nr:DUF1380 family protein [Citrobacter amalonaticus]MDV0787612.1 DUF1380 family protein [Citrobacter amalonaticus]MEB0643676.1 DUF1380 family protein [Citrobacter amalonaticus]